MHYEGNIIRPPSEANSILLQVTVGCSRNKCTFCGTYTGERFRIKPDAVIMEDIAFAAQYCRRQRRVFLCDGDALIIPQKRLVKILTEIRKQLPWVTRVGLYANAKSLEMKTSEQLEELSSSIASLQHQMYKLLSKEIGQDTEMLLLLGKRNAEERLAAFLLSLSERFDRRGFSPRDFYLSMSRHEIGNYLGLAVETVSRLFTRFQDEGLLQVERKHIQLKDLDGLRAVLTGSASGNHRRQIP